MKLAWLTDVHLNFVGRSAVEELCNAIRLSGVDAVMITGDLASSKHLYQYLDYLADGLKMPIYFILGNHDYYGSSIHQVNFEVGGGVKARENLFWLSRSGVVELTPDICLIGHEGLADGRLGNPNDSDVMLNDYYQIEELRQPSKELRLEVQHKLGDEAAAYLKEQLREAVGVRQYKSVIVALHVPPFAEACWHEGNLSDANFLPHFGCKATGEVLREYAQNFPAVDFVVYCGHTHSPGYAEILPNLKVHTAGAEYGQPRIERILCFD
ncbi:metallophosphoesterase [Oryzomonas japonica]|uniref:Metallophosphoesterase n=1 Tax=Oryzomonas japonica TaxID=2603858 RepID=A0A7J4ZW95_9BACT|nr:metallophosphoesterase [Oryzomonas japonica]KAB0667701.1 metallophosphoesterase [Oryzomonas japonica]